MSYHANPKDIELVEIAAAQLDTDALSLRYANTVPPRHTDWKGDTRARDEFQALKQRSRELYILADRMKQ